MIRNAQKEDKENITKNGIISSEFIEHKKQILSIASRNYISKLMEFEIPRINDDIAIQAFIEEKMEHMQGVVYLQKGCCKGYLLYQLWEEDNILHCNIPIWGYGAEGEDRTKIVSLLFQELAGQLVNGKVVSFSVHIYAQDLEIQRLFSYMEFGIQAETGVRLLQKNDINKEYCIRKIEVSEIGKRWSEIWALLSKLIMHLKESPIFYPGNEFTEDVYKEFFEDEDTNVFIAEENGRIIGVIETNPERNEFIFRKEESANVGEAFVLPEYRGTKLAESLLFYAENELLMKQCSYEWVEHGTANPNARGFWNKYFSTYEYEFVRCIGGI